jgi:C4-type Zn-finger protein
MHIDDNEDSELDCPVCRLTFHTYATLEDHMHEHEGLPHCNKCGQDIYGPYHRC